jgi:hypothetical protein
MNASEFCLQPHFYEEHRIIRFRQTTWPTVLGLVIWGTLFGFCSFVLFGLCIGFFVSLYHQL